MRESVPTGLPDSPPVSWAVRPGPSAGRLLVTVHAPMLPDTSFETGPVAKQVEVTFANLKQAMETAGGSLDDVLQVIVYLTDVADGPAVNECWRRYFREPWPNRAIIGCAGLVIPGMKVEIVATAWLAG